MEGYVGILCLAGYSGALRPVLNRGVSLRTEGSNGENGLNFIHLVRQLTLAFRFDNVLHCIGNAFDALDTCRDLLKKPAVLSPTEPLQGTDATIDTRRALVHLKEPQGLFYECKMVPGATCRSVTNANVGTVDQLNKAIEVGRRGAEVDVVKKSADCGEAECCISDGVVGNGGHATKGSSEYQVGGGCFHGGDVEGKVLRKSSWREHFYNPGRQWY
ncbi:hypothetical protein B0H16DRAFT_1570775 [Mycena metata]|uniref:Uncharacterized protein n=1 Tax=Mycena metata TaxID=1033252 RepID=A0AAD7N062_9AGAR|nr:hypothetical protein B0H16DRAFT_1570775 [Mycena metata]